jgi:L-tartrate/succinate antiporter
MATKIDATRHEASGGAISTTVAPAAAPARIRKWEALVPVAVTLVLALLPTPPGLSHFAWLYSSVFAGVIVGLVLEPLPGAAIAIIGLTVVAVLARFVLFSPQQLSAPDFRAASAAITWALPGYSNPTVWLIFGAFILALSYERMGLGERALLLVKRMAKNTLLRGCGVTLADTTLAPFIPSPTARSGGIIYPIVSELALIYGSKPNDILAGRVGSYLMWVAIATTCVTSSLFLTAGSFNLLAVGLVEKLTKTDLGWTDWFSSAAPALIPLLILIPLLTYWLYPPEVKHSTEVSQRAAGGAFINATTVAFVAVSLMLITRVVTWADVVVDKRAWTTFAWLGAPIALCDGLNRVGFIKWFADGIASHMKGFSPLLAMLILLVVFFVAHYLSASVDAYTTALLPVILITGISIPGIPVKEFALLLCLELGIMGIITPFADAASPIYANSGYLPSRDYWRLGTIFGAIFLILFLAIGAPWASSCGGSNV